jgi:hypothetical protein
VLQIQAEHKQPAFAVVRCPTKGKNIDNPNTTTPHNRETVTSEPTTKLASIFDTLLSSQRSDAHRSPTEVVDPGLPFGVSRPPFPDRPNHSKLPARPHPGQIRIRREAEWFPVSEPGSTARPCTEVPDHRDGGVNSAGPACLVRDVHPTAWRPLLPHGLTSRTLNER